MGSGPHFSSRASTKPTLRGIYHWKCVPDPIFIVSITRAEFRFLFFSLMLVRHQITIEARHRKALGFESLPLENGGVASTD